MPMLFSEVRERGAKLLEEYAAECCIPQLGQPDPQWATYEMLQASGKLHVFGVSNAGGLRGFAAVLISALPHYGVRAAIVESLFVGSEYRRTGAGPLLMRGIETFAGLAGCKAILYSAPAGGKFEAVLDADEHYVRTNAVFCKALG